jgi:putative ABC transport system permease protein
MATLWQDLRYGARMLLKKPGFILIAVVMLALGIGANTAVFSLVNSLFLRPLPVKDAGQLVGVYEFRNGQVGMEDLSYADYLDYRDRNTVFSGLAAHSHVWFWLAEGDASSELEGSLVTANYFSVLGVQPHLGRFFLTEEDAVPGTHPVAVLSYWLWQQRFKGDPAILGRTLRMNRLAITVVGIAPNGFAGVHAGSNIDVWMPAMMSGMGRPTRDEFGRSRVWLDLIGRLKLGRTIEEARAEFATLARQLETAYPETNKGLGVHLVPLKGLHPLTREVAFRVPALLTAAVACVLLVACANLAGLLLARSGARRKEIAIRLALGASRARLIRQLLTESLLLALAGGAIGLLIAVWTEDWIVTFYAYGFSGLNLSLDLLTLGLTFALSVFTGLLFGLAPALQATRPNLVLALKDDGASTGYRRSWLRSALVITQVALSLLLLIGAGLLLRSLSNVMTNAGFDPHHIAHFRLRPSRTGYDTERAQTYHREVIRRMESLPGVQSAVLQGSGTPSFGGSMVTIGLPGQAPAQPENAFRIVSHEITPRYLATVKILLLAGREFDERDRKGAPPVAIVNETLARQQWPGQRAIGGRIIVDGREHEVVGIARDALPRSSDRLPSPFIYLAYWQRELIDSRLLVRVAGDPRAMLTLLRQEVIAVDPDVHIGQEMSLAERTWMTFQSERLISNSLIGLGSIALFLSAIGLYGLLAFAISQRTREIGIRMALGARQIDVLWLVVREGVKLAVIGITIGLVGAFVITRVLASFLYGVTATDTMTFIGISLLLAVVALLACYLPARRATEVDPMVALRYE